MAIYSLKTRDIWDKKKDGISEKKSMKGRKKDREKSQPGVRSRVGFCVLIFVFARTILRTQFEFLDSSFVFRFA